MGKARVVLAAFVTAGFLACGSASPAMTPEPGRSPEASATGVPSPSATPASTVTPAGSTSTPTAAPTTTPPPPPSRESSTTQASPTSPTPTATPTAVPPPTKDAAPSATVGTPPSPTATIAAPSVTVLDGGGETALSPGTYQFPTAREGNRPLIIDIPPSELQLAWTSLRINGAVSFCFTELTSDSRLCLEVHDGSEAGRRIADGVDEDDAVAIGAFFDRIVESARLGDAP